MAGTHQEKAVTPSRYSPGPTWVNFVRVTNAANNYAPPPTQETRHLCLHAKFHPDRFISHTLQKIAPKYQNFNQILKFRGSCAHHPFADQGQIWHARGGPKTSSNMTNFTMIGLHNDILQCITMQTWTTLEILGAPEPTPINTYQGQIWNTGADAKCSMTCQIVSGSVYSVALQRRKPRPHFTAFSTSAFYDGAAQWCRDKVELRRTTTNLHRSNDIKSTSTFERLLGKVNRSNFTFQEHDRQTDRQKDTKKLNICKTRQGDTVF